jgi:alpha-galactosidase
LGYEYIDAQTFASWGVDYLKYDHCNNDDARNLPSILLEFTTMRKCAQNATGRPIFYSLCQVGRGKTFWQWAPAVGQCLANHV